MPAAAHDLHNGRVFRLAADGFLQLHKRSSRLQIDLLLLYPVLPRFASMRAIRAVVCSGCLPVNVPDKGLRLSQRAALFPGQLRKIVVLRFFPRNVGADGSLDAHIAVRRMNSARLAPERAALQLRHAHAKRRRVAQQLLRHTTTLGVRMAQLERRTLRRETRTVHTPDGDVRVKTAIGSDIAREKAEYDDLAQLARKKGCTLAEAETFVRDIDRQAP